MERQGKAADDSIISLSSDLQAARQQAQIIEKGIQGAWEAFGKHQAVKATITEMRAQLKAREQAQKRALERDTGRGWSM